MNGFAARLTQIITICGPVSTITLAIGLPAGKASSAQGTTTRDVYGRGFYGPPRKQHLAAGIALYRPCRCIASVRCLQQRVERLRNKGSSYAALTRVCVQDTKAFAAMIAFTHHWTAKLRSSMALS